MSDYIDPVNGLPWPLTDQDAAPQPRASMALPGQAPMTERRPAGYNAALWSKLAELDALIAGEQPHG